MSSIELWSDDLHILIRADSEEDGKSLYARAVSHLVREADIHGWDKQEVEYGGDDHVLERFCSDVLAAVAHS
jgi:hypothetical protein